jgi:hypothetical protein
MKRLGKKIEVSKRRIFFFASAIIFSLLISPLSAIAGPSVTSISGNLSDGQQFIIQGSSFGTHALTFSWTGANIEAGTSGSDFSMSGWSVNHGGGAPNPKYSTTRAHSGTKSIVQAWPTGYTSAFMRDTGGVQTAMFASYWTYIAWNASANACQFKQVRWRPDAAVGDVTGEFMYSSWYNSNSSCYQAYLCDFVTGVNCFEASGDYTDCTTPGRWVRKDVYWVNGTSNGTLDIKEYTNPGTSTPVSWFSDVGSFANVSNNQHRWFVFEGYCGNCSSGSCASNSVYYDDVYIQSGTQARVEICDKSTWAARTHCEIQIPSAWSTSSITVTANRGSFSNGTAAYSYVVDANGAVNAQGYPITIGSGGDVVLGPPQNLRVQQ